MSYTNVAKPLLIFCTDVSMYREPTSRKERKQKMEKQKRNELAAGMKNKRRRKYLLAALAVFVIATTVLGLSIEGRDSKLPDGQGNLIAEQTDDKQSLSDEQTKNQTKETNKKEVSINTPQIMINPMSNVNIWNYYFPYYPMNYQIINNINNVYYSGAQFDIQEKGANSLSVN